MNIFTHQNLLLVLSVLLTGLLAGLFYGYACSVTIGLGRLSDLEYLKGFQSINKAIVNPVFLLSFFGPLILLPITTWVHHEPDLSARFFLLLAASVLYAVGVFGVTVLGNVPLNEDLAQLNISKASVPELFSQREKFETPWNNYHMIRTVASVFSFLLTIISVFKIK